MKKNWQNPIHPGEHLAEELDVINMNGNQFAKAIGVVSNRIYKILNGEREITADTARRIGKFCGTGPELWLNLQQKYDLQIARQKGGDLEEIKPYRPTTQSAHSG